MLVPGAAGNFPAEVNGMSANTFRVVIDIDQFTRLLALEWGAAGVRVDALSPGPIQDTEGMRRLAPQGDAGDSQVRALVPLGRMGTPRESAHRAMFLGSDAAACVSGAIIACAGAAQGMLGSMVKGAVRQGLARQA
ncbi:MAG TPA: SDR family oxidoreductase [Rubrivivax sp.]|nr:SDR family oxidoreductase [Rubrivivax sp.]